MMKLSNYSKSKLNLKRILGLLGAITPCIFVTPAWAHQTATLAWQPSPDTNVAGYFLYYGTATGKYTARVDVGTNTSTTIHGADGGSTYYCSVTAHNLAGDESDLSNEAKVIIPATGALRLAAVNDYYVTKPNWLRFTNSSQNVLNPSATNRIYSLDPGSPAGMVINPTTGRVTWNPTIPQAGSTNQLTVRVMDTANPALLDAQSFSVAVADSAQLNLLPLVAISNGTSGLIDVAINTSAYFSNISFQLNAPSSWASSVTVESLLTNATITQTPAGSLNSLVTLKINDGNYVKGIKTVARVHVNTVAQSTSGFGQLYTTNLFVTQPGGTAISTVSGTNTSLVLVGLDSVIGTISAGPATVPQMVVYGPVGARYNIESSTNLNGAGTWTVEYTTTLTNIYQVIPQLANGAVFKRYRAHRF